MINYQNGKRKVRALRKLLKVGGSSMVTLPPDVLNDLGIIPGQSFPIKTRDGKIKKKTIELEFIS